MVSKRLQLLDTCGVGRHFKTVFRFITTCMYFPSLVSKSNFFKIEQNKTRTSVRGGRSSSSSSGRGSVSGGGGGGGGGSSSSSSSIYQRVTRNYNIVIRKQ